MKALTKLASLGILCICASAAAMDGGRETTTKTIVATTGEKLTGRLSVPHEVPEGRAGLIRAEIINPPQNRFALDREFPVRLQLDAAGLGEVRFRSTDGWGGCVVTDARDDRAGPGIAEVFCQTAAALAPGKRAVLELDAYWEQPGRVVGVSWENISLGIDIVAADGPRLEVGIEPWSISARDPSPDVVETFQEIDFLITLGYFGELGECAEAPLASVTLEDVLPEQFVVAGRTAGIGGQVVPFEGSAVMKDIPCVERGSPAARDTGNLARVHVWGQFQKQGIYWIEAVGTAGGPQAREQVDRGRYRVVTMRTETDRWCVAEVDLEIKNRAPQRVDFGEDFRYTLSVRNNGPVAASDVLIIATLPESVMFRGFATDKEDAACSIDDGMVECAIEDLEAGGRRTIEVEVTAPDARDRFRTCAGISANEFDPVRSGNFSCRTTTVGTGDQSDGPGGPAGTT